MAPNSDGAETNTPSAIRSDGAKTKAARRPKLSQGLESVKSEGTPKCATRLGSGHRNADNCHRPQSLMTPPAPADSAAAAAAADPCRSSMEASTRMNLKAPAASARATLRCTRVWPAGHVHASRAASATAPPKKWHRRRCVPRPPATPPPRAMPIRSRQDGRSTAAVPAAALAAAVLALRASVAVWRARARERSCSGMSVRAGASYALARGFFRQRVTHLSNLENIPFQTAKYRHDLTGQQCARTALTAGLGTTRIGQHHRQSPDEWAVHSRGLHHL
jgi:hypothetical protein